MICEVLVLDSTRVSASLSLLEAIWTSNVYLPLYILSLANHGFLPRDGRNITVDAILQAGLGGWIFFLVCC